VQTSGYILPKAVIKHFQILATNDGKYIQIVKIKTSLSRATVEATLTLNRSPRRSSAQT
jgi:hypothetical protein